MLKANLRFCLHASQPDAAKPLSLSPAWVQQPPLARDFVVFVWHSPSRNGRLLGYVNEAFYVIRLHLKSGSNLVRCTKSPFRRREELVVVCWLFCLREEAQQETSKLTHA